MAGEGTQQPHKKPRYNHGNAAHGRGRGRGRGRVGGQLSPPSAQQTPSVTPSATLRTMPCSPTIWRRYFPNEDYDQQVHGSSLWNALLEYFQSQVNTGLLTANRPDSLGSQSALANQDSAKLAVPIQYRALKLYLADNSMDGDEVCNQLETLLVQQPLRFFALAGLAIHMALFGNGQASGVSEERVVVPRLQGYDHISSIKDLRASIIGTLVTVRGTVVRISSVKPLVTQMAFTCNACTQQRILHFEDGKFNMPGKCQTTGCRGKSFTPEKESPDTVTVDYQKIKIQEKLMDEFSDAGRVPRTVECEITEDLVDCVIPGDVVTISGVVKYTQLQEQKGKNKGNNMHVLYIDANSIAKTTSSSSPATTTPTAGEGASKNLHDAYTHGDGKDSMELDLRDYYAIREVAQEPNLFKLLVHSLCPSIFGHEVVKAGLLLALFGGRQRYLGDNHAVSIRGDSHVLVVGDPGLGKSQMLSAVVNAAPRGVYVCSNTATSSGLTVTLTRESGSGEFALEAGALVLADQGCCCIDEFDKMTEYEALLEAMEQQSISIAKAGVLCNLPARTSVVAAANPVGGHYNKAKTVSENLKMEAALLSRFDLIFILLDRPNEEMDRFLSEHVMKLHAGKLSRQDSGGRSMGGAGGGSHGRTTPLLSSPIATQPAATETTLLERLKQNPEDQLDLLPLSLLRKYIAYSRQYVHPRLSPEAAVVLQDFYIQLRSKNRSLDSTPITTRQLESMIRLSEARARSELRLVVTKEDAQDVVDLMKWSLYDTYSDLTGELQFSRSQMGTGMSRKEEMKRFVGRLHALFRQSSNDLFTFAQLQTIANEMNIRCDNFRDFVDMLRHQQYLLLRGNQTYKLLLGT